MTTLDAIAYAVNVENQGSNLVGDHASGVGTLTVTSVYNFPATGSVDINGDIYEYTAVDELANTLTLSGTTTASYVDGDRVELSPASPIWYATVVVGSDQPGFNAMVPIHLVPFLAEGFWADGIPVILESIEAGEYQWQVVATPGQQPVYDARSAPIVVSNADGESATVSAPGFQTHTNNPVPVRTIAAGAYAGVAVDGTYVYGIHNDASHIDYIRKFDPSTGVEVVSGFPIAGTPTFEDYTLTTDGTYVYVVDSSTKDIRKYNATTGVEVVSGFPIAGTFVDALATDGTYLYAIDSSADIRKYSAATGVEDTGGDFPLVGSYKFGLATDGTHLFAIDSANDIRKFSVATGVEDTADDFPIAGSFVFIAVGGGSLYATDSSGGSYDIRKYDVTTGVEQTDGGFPIEGPLPRGLAVNDPYICAVDAYADIRVFNNADGYESTHTDSADGTFNGHAANVSDLNAAGDITGSGKLAVDGSASLPLLGNSDQKMLTANAVPTSTTNVTMPSLDMTFSVSGVSDVVWVRCHAAVTIGVANTINIIELLIDGVAQAAQLWTRANAVNNIITGAQEWRLTGLAAGSHTIAFRTRNTAAATSATVNVGPTSASYWTTT